MGQEFTNVSFAKPLWMYAIDVYSENKNAFLHYQEAEHLCVNDLIALGFCHLHHLNCSQPWWQQTQLQSLRSMIRDLRSLRNAAANRSIRDIILKVELACEQQDLNFIAEHLVKSSNRFSLFTHYYSEHSVNDPASLTQFIVNLNQKKGA